MKDKKSVLVLWEELPLGILANTAAILGISMGIQDHDLIREDIVDHDQLLHPGIVQYPLPILKASQETLQTLYEKLQDSPDDLYYVDFTDIAQGCIDYDDYVQKMKEAPTKTMKFYGIGLSGTKKAVNRLSGSLPLLR